MSKLPDNYLTNVNDRCRLILYTYLAKNRTLSFLENYEYKKLKSIYIDNDRYFDILKTSLFARVFLITTNSELIQMPNGDLEYENDLPKVTIITPLGEQALKSGLLPSETKESASKLVREWLPIILSTIALVVTLLDSLDVFHNAYQDSSKTNQNGCPP